MFPERRASRDKAKKPDRQFPYTLTRVGRIERAAPETGRRIPLPAGQRERNCAALPAAGNPLLNLVPGWDGTAGIERLYAACSYGNGTYHRRFWPGVVQDVRQQARDSGIT